MLKILGVPAADTASDYYRVYMPLLNLAEQGKALVQFQPMIEMPGGDPIRRVRVGKPDQAQRMQIIEQFGYRNIAQAKQYLSTFEIGPDASQFDVVVLTRRWEPQAAQLIGWLKNAGVTTIYDMDDDAFAVPRMNPAYMRWGTDGAQVLRWYKWTGEKPPFSPLTPQVARAFNKKMLDGVVACCRLADAVTVTTPALAQVYRAFNKNTFVIPNQMCASHWTRVRPIEHPGERWFGWAGSKTHYEDLIGMKDAIAEVLRRVPDSYFVCLGFPNIVTDHMKDLPMDRVRLFDYMPLNEYRDVLAGIEVIWAPSRVSKFNDGKSDIRVLEAWMTLNPVVASETTYGPTVRKAGGGLVATSKGEWVNATVKLLTDEAQRKNMAMRGLEYTANERSYETQAYRWFDVYAQVCGRVSERIAA